MSAVYVGVFGLAGVFARYLVGMAAQKYFASDFPYATFAINLFGAFFIGLVYVFGVERHLLSAELRLGIMVGFFGGFTTFSSYCLEGVGLLERGHHLSAFAYIALSPIIGIGLAFAGVAIGRKVMGV